MIGFYNYTVILTYLGLLSSCLGIFLTYQGHYLVAVFCLIISGLCDMFDGVVARSCKTRSEQAKCFGIQIDSLCDLICFGVYPAIFGYIFTCRYYPDMTLISVPVSSLFILCAVIRLGYFNVMEMERQKQTTEARKHYQGVPVTSIAGLLPLVFIFRNTLGYMNFALALNILLLCIAVLFVLNIKIPKPHKKGIIIMSLMFLVVMIVLVLQGLEVINF